MSKKKSPEAKLAEAVSELGIEKAEGYIQFLKALNKPEPKPRKIREVKAAGGNQ